MKLDTMTTPKQNKPVTSKPSISSVPQQPVLVKKNEPSLLDLEPNDGN